MSDKPNSPGESALVYVGVAAGVVILALVLISLLGWWEPLVALFRSPAPVSVPPP